MVERVDRMSPSDVHELISSPIMSQTLPETTLGQSSELLEYFGIKIDPRSDPNEFVMALEVMDPRHKGEEGRKLVRFQLEKHPNTWPVDANRIIISTAKNFGMVTQTEVECAAAHRAGLVIPDQLAAANTTETGLVVLQGETPLVGPFDYIIPFGGARQAPLDRMMYAATAIHNGAATGRLVGAGSDRKLGIVELEAVRDYAPHATKEWHLLKAAELVVQEAFSDLIPATIRVPQEKANTPMLVESVITMLPKGNVGRMAGVTTQIYQRFTESDMRTVAKKNGIYSAVAANPSDLKIVVNRTPATYLSEIIRTLRAVTLELAN